MYLDVREDLAHVLKLVGRLLEGQVGVVEIQHLNLGHVHLRNVGSKLYQKFQLQGKVREYPRGQLGKGSSLTSGSLTEVA